MEFPPVSAESQLQLDMIYLFACPYIKFDQYIAVLQSAARAHPSAVAVRARGCEGAGQWVEQSYSQLAEQVETVSRAFLAAGLEAGHAVAVV